MRDLSWAVPASSVIGVLGPNGAGKTTLLRVLATVLQPTGGQMLLSGEAISRERRRLLRESLGYLPQDYGYYPSFTAGEAVAYAGWLKGISATESWARSRAALMKVDLLDRKDFPMRSLSGGQVRRVGIAQALINEPTLLLLDEPTSGLDPAMRIAFRDLISDLAETASIIVSTHLVEDVATTCDYVLVMSGGRIRFSGAPAQLSGVGTTSRVQGVSALEEGYLTVMAGAEY